MQVALAVIKETVVLTKCFKEYFIFHLTLDHIKRVQRSARIDSHVINHPLPFSVTVSFSFLPSSNSDRIYIDTYIYVSLYRSTSRFLSTVPQLLHVTYPGRSLPTIYLSTIALLHKPLIPFVGHADRRYDPRNPHFILYRALYALFLSYMRARVMNKSYSKKFEKHFFLYQNLQIFYDCPFYDCTT